jgi:hypothetical protein
VGPLGDEVRQARPQLKSGDVLAIATSWEWWVLRETDLTDALVDAF